MSGSSESSIGIHQDAIIHRYEKKIKKTHRVADKTEKKLKKQQTFLLHYKNLHAIKLQALSICNDPRSQKNFKYTQTKKNQLDRVISYFGVLITLNKKAEMKTIAVLEENCTVELQKLSQVKFIQQCKPIDETDSSKSNDFPDSTIPLPLSVLQVQPCEVPPLMTNPTVQNQSDESLMHDTVLTHENITANAANTSDLMTSPGDTEKVNLSSENILSPLDHEVLSHCPPVRVDSITPVQTYNYEQTSLDVPSTQASFPRNTQY